MILESDVYLLKKCEKGADAKPEEKEAALRLARDGYLQIVEPQLDTSDGGDFGAVPTQLGNDLLGDLAEGTPLAEVAMVGETLPDIMPHPFRQMLVALKMAYRYIHLGDVDIGSGEMSDARHCALCEAMEDGGYQLWANQGYPVTPIWIGEKPLPLIGGEE